MLLEQVEKVIRPETKLVGYRIEASLNEDIKYRHVDHLRNQLAATLQA